MAAVVCTAQTANMAGRKWLRLAGRSTGTGTALVVLGVRVPRVAWARLSGRTGWLAGLLSDSQLAGTAIPLPLS